MKKSFKLAFIALLFVCIILVPVLGVSFYDSPSIFSENAVISNQKFGGGSSVLLSLDTSDATINTKENLDKTAKILETRFIDQGYNDAKTTVVDKNVKLNFSEKNLVNSAITSIACIGEWTLSPTDGSGTILCDQSMVKDAAVSANSDGSYAITIFFTDSGKSEFVANTASLAISGSALYFNIDGTPASYGYATETSSSDTYTFGQFANYSDAARYVSIIKNGKLPSAVKVEKIEKFGPTLGTKTLTTIYVSLAVALILFVVILIVKGKFFGIFASLALVSNVAIFLTALANANFILNTVTLVSAAVCVLLLTVYYLFAISNAGKGQKALNRFNVKTIWIHAIPLAISLLVSFFARGSALYIARMILLFSCSNFVLYFVFLYFGICTLADKK